MKYHYQYRQAPEGFGWNPIREAVDAPIVEEGEIEAVSPGAACEQLFFLHNVDERPRGREIRSMSVGDVIVISSPAEQRAPLTEEAIYVCAMVGFKKVDEEDLAKTVYNIAPEV